eukprot:Clim_evm3s5 gene=Clim_evmTU3s5
MAKITAFLSLGCPRSYSIFLLLRRAQKTLSGQLDVEYCPVNGRDIQDLAAEGDPEWFKFTTQKEAFLKYSDFQMLQYVQWLCESEQVTHQRALSLAEEKEVNMQVSAEIMQSQEDLESPRTMSILSSAFEEVYLYNEKLNDVGQPDKHGKGKALNEESAQKANKMGVFSSAAMVVENTGHVWIGPEQVPFALAEAGLVQNADLADGGLLTMFDAKDRILREYGYTQPTDVNMKFYFDFASPFAYLTHRAVKTMQARLQGDLKGSNANLKVEGVPVLLGALMVGLKTDMKRFFAQPQLKRNNENLVMAAFQNSWTGADKLKFNSGFPLVTIPALRSYIASGKDPKALDALFKLAWEEDGNTNDKAQVADALNRAGFDGKALIEKTNDPEVKSSLVKNTEKAGAMGLFGVPNFQINNGPIVYGQDKLPLVMAQICGWKPDKALNLQLPAKM